MNKSAIKNFAIWARVQLIEAAKQRAYEYEITENGENKSGLDMVGGRLLTKAEKEQRSQLISEINRKGYSQVMEEAAYTWFNRFIALRFMEVNGYLPSKVRVFTDENGAFKPEILKQAMSIELEGLDRNKVLDLLDRQDNEELYKYLLITQCNALNSGLPYMFEKISNWTELLFPANLLRQDSVLGQMISEIPEEDWTDAVQIIGWLYQYYNSELKDETFAMLKKNVKISKERIPSATQLFTPDWIVRYMVENSLGRLWYEGHLDFNKSQWKYYLDEAKQEPEVEAQLKKIRFEYSQIRPEEIKVIDPCMGSGHILVYAFDVLMQIYTSAGWSERDAAKSILENNLYGLDIDDRAGQLAYFAVMMKARKYSRRILNGEVKPNVISIQDSNWITDDFIAYVAGTDTNMRADLIMLRKTFKDAKEYGSILNVSTMQYDSLYERIEVISRSYAEDLFQAQYKETVVEELLPLIKQSQIMSQKYDVVVTNPPYMGSNGMSEALSSFVKKEYPNTKSDLSTVCMEKAMHFCKPLGYWAMINIPVWMFLSTYQSFRKILLDRATIINMVHPGRGVFGSDFGTTSFVFINSDKSISKVDLSSYKATYYRLFDRQGEVQSIEVLQERFNGRQGKYLAVQKDFNNLPGEPIAYWAGKNLLVAMAGTKLEKYVSLVEGVHTRDNDTFLRVWFETSLDKTALYTFEKDKKWFPYNKGGSFRQWYGNNEYVINWENDGQDIKSFKKASIGKTSHYFEQGITLTLVTAARNSFRYSRSGALYDVSGPTLYCNSNLLNYILGFIAGKIAYKVLRIYNPTISIQIGDIKKLPLIVNEKYVVDVNRLVEENINISKLDWDSFETSWDFVRHPLLPETKTTNMHLIEDKYKEWEAECEARFNQLKANEEELNRIFIEIYGLQDELTPDVEDRDVTVRKADLQREIKSLISYAVGCMFGRYSVDVEGLCYAGGEWDASKYKTIIPDSDNIIPICDDDYFDDDIVGKFVDFVRKVYGEETLEENLRFVADALGGKGTSREVIRNYFLNDFFVDHCSTYSVTGSGKRPIYWLFSSGKKNGFKALIYMHRYQPDLLARMRTDYVHEQQERYRTQLQMLEISAQSAAPSERVKLNKQITKLKDQALEIQKYEEKIHHLADQMISIDLDDGVKVNYARFQDVLEKIK